MIYDNIIILFSGATVGLILFQTIVIAPTFFKTLEIENSRKLLRIIFPKFFIFIVLINLTSIFISVIGGINYKDNIYSRSNYTYCDIMLLPYSRD